MWPFRKKEPVLTAHNILGRNIIHTVTEKVTSGEYKTLVYGGTVKSTTVDPINERVLIVFDDDTHSIWNPEHEQEPYKNEVGNFIELNE